MHFELEFQFNITTVQAYRCIRYVSPRILFEGCGSPLNGLLHFSYQIHRHPHHFYKIFGMVKIHLYVIIVPIGASKPVGNLRLTIITRSFDSHVSLNVTYLFVRSAQTPWTRGGPRSDTRDLCRRW